MRDDDCITKLKTHKHKIFDPPPKNNAMGASPVLNDAEAKDSTVQPSRDGAVPSGFILKLYQMCNGAPDDVISVSLFSCSVDEPQMTRGVSIGRCWERVM